MLQLMGERKRIEGILGARHACRRSHFRKSAGGLCGSTARRWREAASPAAVPQTCGPARMPKALAMVISLDT